MTDSRPPIPPSTQAALPPSPRAESTDSVTGKIIGVPNDMRDSRQNIKVRGEVTDVRRDPKTKETIVRVRTERGEVEVRLPPESTPPKQGTRVELEIRPAPPDARPQPVRGEPAPVQQAQTVIVRPAPPEIQKPAAPEQRPSATPVEVEIRPQPVASSAPVQEGAVTRSAPSSWPPLAPGDVVRLQPVTPRDVVLPFMPYVADMPEIIVNTIVQGASIKARSVATEVQNFILTQSPQAADDATPVPLTSYAPMNISTPAVPTQGLEVTPIPPPAPSLEVPTPVNFMSPQALNIIQPEGIAAITDVALPALKVQAFQARIESIVPPGPEFTAPDTAAAENFKAQIKADAGVILNTAPQEQKAGTITAVAAGVTPQNLTVLNLFLPSAAMPQSFILQAPVEALPTGTIVQIVPQSAATIAPAPINWATMPLPPFSSLLTPESWPIMDEILQSLTHAAPQAARAMMNVTPNASNPGNLGPAALFFIAAVRGGDLTGWLGDKAIDALRRDGRGGLLSRLTQEGNILNRMNAEPVSQDWKAITLPMFYEGEIQKMALYYKNDREGREGEDNEGGQTRFIFDLSLNNMGKVQIDGLFRPGRLDLVLRTETHLSPAMQKDMRQTYATALKEANVTGELSFQGQQGSWVKINVQQKSFGAQVYASLRANIVSEAIQSGTHGSGLLRQASSLPRNDGYYSFSCFLRKTSRPMASSSSDSFLLISFSSSSSRRSCVISIFLSSAKASRMSSRAMSMRVSSLEMASAMSLMRSRTASV
jgi:hypothetical protein